MQLARGVLIAGKYRIERALATGGMGSVWVARHAQLDTPVAVKFMDSQSASSTVARARFEREAKSSAALRNRHVVQVLDYGLEGDVPYLVMELLQGEDLSKRLHRERRLPLATASRILTQTAKGLRTAHDAGVVHRDLKPANIFLAREADEDEEIVKILDFGIAKETTNPLIGEGTKTGELMGSPHYMSPEQVRAAKDIDHRSDLWSLAVITFRAVTGRMPFMGDNIGAVIAQILADPIPVATEIAPDLPREIDAFFARGFARDREQRFQTAREMAEAFAALATAASEAARWSVADEGPTRPRMPSNYPIETVADVLPPSSTRADMPSIPTEAMAPPSEAPPTPSATLAPNGLGGTGGPLIQTARPPAAVSPSPLRWLPLAGAGAGVLIGVVAFIVVRPGSSAAPAAVGTTTPAASATATEVASATPPPTSEAAKPEPSAEPTIAASASASATATAAPSTKPTSKPKEAAKPPAAPPPAKKKPNWGF